MQDETEFEEDELTKARLSIAAGQEATVELRYVEAALTKIKDAAYRELLLPQTTADRRVSCIATLQVLEFIRSEINKPIIAGKSAENLLNMIESQKEDNDE